MSRVRTLVSTDPTSVASGLAHPEHAIPAAHKVNHLSLRGTLTYPGPLPRPRLVPARPRPAPAPASDARRSSPRGASGGASRRRARGVASRREAADWTARASHARPFPPRVALPGARSEGRAGPCAAGAPRGYPSGTLPSLPGLPRALGGTGRDGGTLLAATSGKGDPRDHGHWRHTDTDKQQPHSPLHHWHYD